jgi:hypothetical protein
MAFDAFVKIEGIPGEALDETYRDGALVCGEVGGAVAGYVGGKIVGDEGGDFGEYLYGKMAQ